LDRDAIHGIAREYRPNATDDRDVAQPEFILRLGCAMGYRMLDPRYDVSLIIGGIATTVMFFIGDQSPTACVRCWRVADHPRSRTERGRTRRLVSDGAGRLEEASYAIYLIHVPLMSLTLRIAARVAFLHNWPGAWTFSLGCGVVVGCAYHYLFERPTLAAIRRTGALRVATQHNREGIAA
jgi:exopolysaccharide production protein ExoZ